MANFYSPRQWLQRQVDTHSDAGAVDYSYCNKRYVPVDSNQLPSLISDISNIPEALND